MATAPLVSQDNVLFSTTIRENITYGLPRAAREAITDAQIEAACRKANAWEFIQTFPHRRMGRVAVWAVPRL